jgi:porin
MLKELNMQNNLWRLMLLGSLMPLSMGLSANQLWSSDRQWLLGDWAGSRQQLAEQGYRFNLNLMNQTASSLSGDATDHRQTRNANQLSLGLDLDLAKIAGWSNTSAALSITKRDGKNLASDIGMSGSPTEIYGRGNIWRLGQAWIKTEVYQHRLQLKAGRMGMSEDFNGSHCHFQSLILCGGQVGKSQGDVWYNGPVGGWAINGRYQVTPEWSVALGVYENNPENLQSQSSHLNLDMAQAKGALIPLELAWKPQFGNALAGEYKLGGFYSSHQYARLDARSGSARKQAIWLNAQQQLTRAAPDSARGLYASFNLVLNDQATASVASTQQLAVWYKGPWAQRPQDQIGFGAGRYAYNRHVAANQDRDQEIDFELNYVYQYSPALMIRPNLQYVYQPNGLASRAESWIAGLSVGLKF